MIEEEVFWFEVAVYDVLAVEVFKNEHHAGGVVHRGVVGEADGLAHCSTRGMLTSVTIFHAVIL